MNAAAAGTPVEMAREMVRGFEGLPRLVWQEGTGGKPGRQAYRTSAPAEGESLEGAAFPVYDDADPKSWWMPYSTQSYEDWAKTLKGRPTLGYGTRYDLLTPERRKAYVDSFGAPGHGWALDRLGDDIRRNFDPVLKRHPHIARMTPAQQASLMSFYYNLGPGAAGKETLEAAIAANDPARIASALGLYRKSGGKVLPGLVRRRQAEAAAFRPQAQAPVSPAAQAVPVQGTWHTVGGGDSLWSLWRNRRDRREKWSAFGSRVRGLNPGTDLDALKPGQRIRLG